METKDILVNLGKAINDMKDMGADTRPYEAQVEELRRALEEMEAYRKG